MAGDRGGRYLGPVTRVLTIAIALVLPAVPARADTPGFLEVADLTGARALAVGAYRGALPGNDAIFLNPGAVGVRRRFALELQYLLDRDASVNGAQWVGVSVVDSETSPLAGGLAATRVASGAWQGWAYHLVLAAPVAQGLRLGAAAKLLDLGGPGGGRALAVTVDAGLHWELTPMVRVGAAGYNLVPAGHRRVMPTMFGAGISVGDDRLYSISADWRGDFDRRDKMASLYAFGLEYLVGDLVPVRAGFVRDESLGDKYWSVGAGLILPNGVALDLGYRQAVGDPSHRTFAGALKVFLLSTQ